MLIGVPAFFHMTAFRTTVFVDHKPAGLGTQRTTCEAFPDFSRICSSIDFIRLYPANCKSSSRSRLSTRSNFSIDKP